MIFFLYVFIVRVSNVNSDMLIGRVKVLKIRITASQTSDWIITPIEHVGTKSVIHFDRFLIKVLFRFH